MLISYLVKYILYSLTSWSIPHAVTFAYLFTTQLALCFHLELKVHQNVIMEDKSLGEFSHAQNKACCLNVKLPVS